MKVLLLGATGMLGSKVYSVLHDKYEVIATTRKEFDAEKVCSSFSYFNDFVKSVGNVDYVINAIGITIPNSMKNPAMTFFINASLPHILAREYGKKLIHITTDCVYSGSDDNAPYTELARHAPRDIYGLSKSLGEPEECLVIRTSIVGIGGDKTGLLEWFLQQTGIVKGYIDHFWNGITTHQFGLVCDRIMSSSQSWCGIHHVFSNSVSKYDMLLAFKKKFDVRCNIIPTSGNPLDRRLATIRELNNWLNIPTFSEMIETI